MGNKERIFNAKNVPIDEKTGTIPDVSGAMTDYYQPMVFNRITKSLEAFQAVETAEVVAFRGFMPPFSNRQLLLKPEGQRAWNWYQLFAEPVLELEVDDIVVYQGEQTRVMAKKNFKNFGYVYYELVQDWEPGTTIITGPGGTPLNNTEGEVITK